MSRLQCRGSIAWVAVVVALLSSRPADAQIVGDPFPARRPDSLYNALITGAEYDILNQAHAEHQLQKVQAKLRSDVERGDSAAAACDVRRIDNLRFRIVVDEWLIRKNLYDCSGPYPYPLRLDPITCAALADARRPPFYPIPRQTGAGSASGTLPMTATPTIEITIVNTATTGPDVAFTIDGVAHQVSAGSSLNLAVAPNSTITYDGGGSLGQRRYRTSPGLYEFRSTAEGLALYKVPDLP